MHVLNPPNKLHTLLQDVALNLPGASTPALLPTSILSHAWHSTNGPFLLIALHVLPSNKSHSYKYGWTSLRAE